MLVFLKILPYISPLKGRLHCTTSLHFTPENIAPRTVVVVQPAQMNVIPCASTTHSCSSVEGNKSQPKINKSLILVLRLFPGTAEHAVKFSCSVSNSEDNFVPRIHFYLEVTVLWINNETVLCSFRSIMGCGATGGEKMYQILCLFHSVPRNRLEGI